MNPIIAFVLGLLPAQFQPFVKDIEADLTAKGIVNPIPQLNDAIDAFVALFPKYAKVAADVKKLLNDSITIIVPDVESIMTDVKAIG